MTNKLDTGTRTRAVYRANEGRQTDCRREHVTVRGDQPVVETPSTGQFHDCTLNTMLQGYRNEVLRNRRDPGKSVADWAELAQENEG
jgi:hypothetical protein